MRTRRLCLILVLFSIGLVLFFQQFQLEGLDQLQLRRRGDNLVQAESVLTERSSDRLRIATFNLQVFGRTKSSHLPTMQALARICRQFDVIAIQEVAGPGQDALALLVEEMNRFGPQYSYLSSRPLGRSAYKQQYAYIYNRQLLHADLARCCAIEDPDDLFEHPPFVGFFQVREEHSETPFSFTLVNVRIDAENPDRELELLDEVHALIANGTRAEDDVIVLGTFQADSETLDSILGPAGLASTLDKGQFTDTRLSQQVDNIIVHTTATAELKGRSNSFRFMRRFNLSLQQALALSDHLPVWAEFGLSEAALGP
jgi:hypothetical protein